MKTLIHSAQRLLARSKWSVNLCVKLRNQCNCIINHYLTEDANNRADNGEEMLVKHLAPQLSTFVDVGANIGDWSSLILKYAPAECAGMILEPSSRCLVALGQRFQGDARLQIIGAAATEVAGYGAFYEESDNGQTSSLQAEFSASTAERKQVRMTTVDLECAQKGWATLDLLKIDAEGFDFKVIRGAGNLLSRGAVGFIVFEYGNNHSWLKVGDTLGGALRLFAANGYAVYLLKHDGLYSFDYPKWANLEPAAILWRSRRHGTGC